MQDFDLILNIKFKSKVHHAVFSKLINLVDIVQT